MAALCGAEQGKYREYKSALYALEERKSGAKVSDADRILAAKEAGLDDTQVASCLQSDAYKAQVESDIAYGDALRVNSTPTLFLDGKKLDLSIFRDVGMLTKFLDQVVAQ
jgi:protein-disulfide isomerase